MLACGCAGAIIAPGPWAPKVAPGAAMPPPPKVALPGAAPRGPVPCPKVALAGAGPWAPVPCPKVAFAGAGPWAPVRPPNVAFPTG